jgi:hypothetical protein
MHERTYDLAKQTRSKHACIYINVTNEFCFSREGEKEQTCAWNVLGNGVLLDRLWRDLLQRLGRKEESN